MCSESGHSTHFNEPRYPFANLTGGTGSFFLLKNTHTLGKCDFFFPPINIEYGRVVARTRRAKTAKWMHLTIPVYHPPATTDEFGVLPGPERMTHHRQRCSRIRK